MKPALRLALLALLLAPAAALAQMYKCTDARGVTSYSDKPCAGAKGGQVDIQGQPPLSGQLQQRSENLSREEADFKRRQIKRDREEERERASLDKQRAALARRCNTARSELAGLTTARRVVQADSKGGLVYMDDATRERRIAELREQLRSCP